MSTRVSRTVAFLFLASITSLAQYHASQPSSRMDRETPRVPTGPIFHAPQTAMDERLDRRLNYEHMADAYYKAQQWRDAKYYYQEALKLAPKDKGLHKKLEKTEEHLPPERKAVKQAVNQRSGRFDRPAPSLLSPTMTTQATSTAASDGDAPK